MKSKECGITPSQAVVVGVCSLIMGLMLFAAWGLIQVTLGGLPAWVYKVCGDVAKLGIYIAMAKAGLKLAPTYNRTRVWIFMVALAAMLVNMVNEPSAGNIVLRSAQLFMTSWFLLRYRPDHEPFSRCPWRWGICTTMMVLAALAGYGVTKLMPKPLFDAGWWWTVISLAGGLIMYAAVMVQVSRLAESDSYLFLGLYGLGNAVMVLSYMGQYNAAGLFLNSALSVLLIGKLVYKIIHGRRQRKKQPKAMKEVLVNQ